jgi:hypothetical protein
MPGIMTPNFPLAGSMAPLCLARGFSSDFFSFITSTRAGFAFADFCRVAIDWPLPQ